MLRRAVNKKLLQEQQQIGAIYQEYIETFQETSRVPKKLFIKSETLFANGAQNAESKELYTPTPRIKCRKEERTSKASGSGPISKKQSRKKSNLKALGDELKLLQHERQVNEKDSIHKAQLSSVTFEDNSNSTNLFVSNLKPNIMEKHLIEMFGPFGPLASVKIMWPRNDSGKINTNCGFVAFMSRLDAERALKALRSNREEIRISWGKAVKVPSFPVYIPDVLYQLYSPPPPSGLPFNAQNPENSMDLSRTYVKVTIPFNRSLLTTIHRVVEFVVREGSEFEAILISIERTNEDYRFLTDFKHPAHIYYRWKLFSILNGDSKTSWSMKPFRMFKNGPIWYPPIAPNYTSGMSQDLIDEASKKTTVLTTLQLNRLVNLIKNLMPSRSSIATALVFCCNNVNAIDDILDLLLDSFNNISTLPLKKIARLYLISDLIYNCKVRPKLVVGLKKVFTELGTTRQEIKTRKNREAFSLRVMRVLKTWLSFGYFESGFLRQLEDCFLVHDIEMDDEDSFDDEPLDGANLLKRCRQNKKIDMFTYYQ